MNTQELTTANIQPLTQAKSNSHDNFDFELWAKEVKRQMIAALSKNNSQLYAKE